MNPMIVGIGGACAFAATAPLAWALARVWAGQLSAPNAEEWRGVKVSFAGGVFLGLALFAAYPVTLTVLVLIVVGIAGIAGGAAFGWWTRAPQDRNR